MTNRDGPNGNSHGSGGENVVRIATINVNSVAYKVAQIFKLLEHHNVDIACLQEVKCDKNDLNTFSYNAEQSGYKLYNNYGWKGKNGAMYGGVVILSRWPVRPAPLPGSSDIPAAKGRVLTVRVHAPRQRPISHLPY